MPILKSGRAVGVYLKNFVDEMRCDESGEVESITFGYRPQVETIQDLLNILPIYYYDLINGVPNLESPCILGFTFGEIINGADQWTTDEIAELVDWTNSNRELTSWLQTNLVAIKKQECEDKA